MITGNGTLSLRKKDLENQKVPALSFRKTTFAHKAVAGETGFNLASLTTPSELTSNGFSQPSVGELQNAQLLFYRNNLKLVSSARGVLMDFVSYNIVSSTQINWVGFTAEADEIFVVEIDHNARTGMRVVDAAPLVATGTMAAGVQDFSVGMPFQINKYQNMQVGAVTVSVDGVQQYRNSGNATASPGADGNYQEVDAGNGYGTIIRFNTTEVYSRNIAVVSTGLLVEKPNEAQLAELERVQGQIDKIIPTVAELAGVPETDFQAAPNQIQLKQFGDRVLDLEGWEVIITTTLLTQKKHRRILADTSSAPFTLTLPASPKVGDSITIMDAGGAWTTNNLTVARNGQNIIGIADDLLLDASDTWVELVYYSASRGWAVRA